ncbi:MAG: HemK2/MTQ2 family protein methyltransferase, partial [Thermoproteota archaeon]|nr:HemK2/MTQ2 family protein methyltransferase [Thermoproteota archaeon]
MRSLNKNVFFGGQVFLVCEDVYEPAEDTFLAAENLHVKEDDVVLDVGTGCGILGILAAKKARKVVAVDINPHAVRCAQKNAKLNRVAEKMNIRLGNLFTPMKDGEKFSLIIFNAPYLPSEPEEHETWLGKAWAGGSAGRQTINRFISQVTNYLGEDGQAVLVQSSLSSVEETLRRLEKERLHASILAEKKVWF